MKITYSWIRSYVPELDVPAEEFADRMTMSGTKVTGFVRTDRNLKNIVVAEILSGAKHPTAEHLMVYQVNTGSARIQCVTAAQNLQPGDKVPVALEGGSVEMLHGAPENARRGVPVHREMIRGVESQGILCSVEELGFTREKTSDAQEYAIYVFREEVEVGEDAVKALGLSDVIFSFEPASARKDCFRVLGIAREAAAVFGKGFVEPSVEVKANQEKIEDYLKVRVKDGVICPRYCARVVKNVQLGHSPQWMQQRLISCGIRPVNNLVDITNYVMEEYGQPVLAFDLDRLAGHELRLELSEDGNKFRTLDGQLRNVGSRTLMLSDGEAPIGIAGIMGGPTTKVEKSGSTIVLEAACFDGAYIRKATHRLNVTTEISRRFARGLDANYAEQGLNRACQLIEELGCGEVVGGMIDECSTVVGTRHIEFHPDWINRHLGTRMSREEMLGYLYSLGFSYDEVSGDVITPAGRQDILEEAEVAGEVARLYGYDRIPMTIPRVETTRGTLPPKMKMEDEIRSFMEYSGYSQVMTYPFESPEAFDLLQIPYGSSLRNAVRIQNPLSEEYTIMRTQSVSSMMRVLGVNTANRHRHVRFYELANIYLPRDLGRNQLPDERMTLTLASYGADDFFDMKGVVNTLLLEMGLPIRTRVKHIGLANVLTYRNENKRPYFHPGRQAEIYHGGQVIGCIGEIHPGVAASYGVTERVNMVVLDVPTVLKLMQGGQKYRKLNRYGKLIRDLSVLTSERTELREIEDKIMLVARGCLEDIQLAGPVYRGGELPPGTKSITFRLRFQAENHDITGPEVNEVLDRIREYLEETGVSERR